jgi:hypothetical protein
VVLMAGLPTFAFGTPPGALSPDEITFSIGAGVSGTATPASGGRTHQHHLTENMDEPDVSVMDDPSL